MMFSTPKELYREDMAIVWRCRHCKKEYVTGRGTSPSFQLSDHACWDCSNKIIDLLAKQEGCPVCERQVPAENIYSSDKRCKQCKANNIQSRQQFDAYFYAYCKKEYSHSPEAIEQKLQVSRMTWPEPLLQTIRDSNETSHRRVEKYQEKYISDYRQQKNLEKKLMILAATVLAAGVYYGGKKIYDKMRKKPEPEASAINTPDLTISQDLTSSNEE